MGLFVLLFLGIVAIFPDVFAPYAFDEPDFTSLTIPPTMEGQRYFGTDFLGRDTFTRVIYGLRTSLWVALVVALLATVIGTTVGAISGYFGGWVDNGLMRLTDLVLTLPGLAVLLTISVYVGTSDPLRVAVILAPSSGRVRPHRPHTRRCARRSSSRRRRRRVPATRGSSSVTCSRTRSGRSSSTRP